MRMKYKFYYVNKNKSSQRLWEIKNLLRTEGPLTVDMIAYKTGMSKRYVNHLMKELEKRGEVVYIPPRAGEFKLKGVDVNENDLVEVLRKENEELNKIINELLRKIAKLEKGGKNDV